jgi:16S rRNA (guanine1516-N2)-methyltransferase
MSNQPSNFDSLNEYSNIAIGYVHNSDSDQAKRIAKKWKLTYIGDRKVVNQHPTLDFLLQVNDQHLELCKLDEPKLGAISVDFVDGAVSHRRKFGGGRGQDIAKAIGLKHGFTPHVLDATAGLGRDGFLLAGLGCKVTLMERMPIVAALLEDGLERAKLNAEVSDIAEQMNLLHGSSLENMAANMNIAEQPDVIYLDPMYPHREKSALVKKEMRVFQSLVGEDLDADELLAPALALAKYRVVVKRPSYAPPLDGKKPSTSINMKKNRFDVYVNLAIPKPLVNA